MSSALWPGQRRLAVRGEGAGVRPTWRAGPHHQPHHRHWGEHLRLGDRPLGGGRPGGGHPGGQRRGIRGLIASSQRAGLRPIVQDPVVTAISVGGKRPFTGCLRVPGDKSISHRALMIAALGRRPCAIKGLSDGDDVVRTRLAVEALGARVEVAESGEVTVTGGMSGARNPIDLGNSGTGIRLMAGLVAGFDFTTTLDGDASIRQRPMDRIIAPLTEMGASITGRGDSGSLAPLTIEGRSLRGIEYTLPVASAQVKSAVLLAALRAEGPSTVHETVPTRAHTEEMLAAAGVRLERGDCSVTLWPGEVDLPDVEVPGDPSQAAFWVVGACTAPNSDLTVENVYLGPARGGFVEVLQRMGADITVDADSGDIEARSSELRGTLVTAQELPGCIDEVPILAVAAAAAEGTTVFEGIDELRVKETDRVAAVAELLAVLGAGCQIDGDTLAITGVGRAEALGSGTVDSRGDHRMAMAAAIGGAVGNGSMTVEGFEATHTSYPGFARDLDASGGRTP
ncbi:MAG: 3-phosphoshikimate 1-carboxyvinyltransferase [Acidimicrobiia bacterium]|nr:3-phosphoshikimate 1-carboxyvinyltransferase [Acidimicrobiia bacterium]